MAGPQVRTKLRERAPEQRRRPLQIAVVPLEDRQIVDGHGDVGMVAAEHALLYQQRTHVQRTGAVAAPCDAARRRPDRRD